MIDEFVEQCRTCVQMDELPKLFHDFLENKSCQHRTTTDEINKEMKDKIDKGELNILYLSLLQESTSYKIFHLKSHIYKKLILKDILIHSQDLHSKKVISSIWNFLNKIEGHQSKELLVFPEHERKALEKILLEDGESVDNNSKARVIDFISGMTGRYAEDLWRKVSALSVPLFSYN